jgi:hypothetical protein
MLDRCSVGLFRGSLQCDAMLVLPLRLLSYCVGTDGQRHAAYGGAMSTNTDLVHFVGSVPLENSEAVFRRLSGELGRYLRRMPDGETGERTKWIRLHQAMLLEHPDMEVDPTHPPLPVKQADGTILRHIQMVRLKPSSDPDRATFDTTYDRYALESYATFKRLRDQGTIAKKVRFQVTVATPMATGFMYVSPNGRERYLRAYERSLMLALERIVNEIPHDDLSIQYDVCQEVLMFENYFPVPEPDYKNKVFGQLERLGRVVPKNAELGFHLCYGSPGDQPLLRLRDASVLTELMNGITSRAKRRVNFFHIPAPREAGYQFFEPLSQWRRDKGTRLYIGLLQEGDTAGNRARIAAAQIVVPDFGVAAECGFGRRDPSHVPAILASHRDAVEHLLDR